MARIKVYNRNPAASYVGVPQQDNSGAIIANAVASSANVVADQANQNFANQQYQARWMLNQASQDIGQLLQQRQKLNAKQQEYNDFTSAQDAITNFTMDMREQATDEQTRNPNSPEQWAGNFRASGTEKMNGVLQTLTPGARKLAIGAMNNVIESNHGTLVNSGRDARTNLNDLAAQDTALRIRDNAKKAGASGDFQAFKSDMALFDESSKTRLIKTPALEVQKTNLADKEAYFKDFAQEYSNTNPGQIDKLINSEDPEIQAIVNRLGATEIERLRSIDKKNVNEYMTDLSIADRKTKSAYERSDYDRISPVFTKLQDRNSVDAYIGELIKMQSENDTVIKDLSARDQKDLSEGQLNMFYDRREKINGWLEKLSKISTDLANKDETFAKRLTLNNEYNSQAARDARQKISQLEAQINKGGKLKASEKEAALKAYEELNALKQDIDENHPTYLYQPTVDSQGRVMPGDTATMDRRMGRMDESVRRIQTKRSGGGTPAEVIKGWVSGLVSPEAQDIAMSPANAVGVPEHKQDLFQNAVQNAVVGAAAKRKQNGQDTSPQQAAADKAFYTKWYQERPNEIPEPAKPATKTLTGGVSKNTSKPNSKSGLVPPPPATKLGAAGIDGMWHSMLQTIPKNVIQSYLEGSDGG